LYASESWWDKTARQYMEKLYKSRMFSDPVFVLHDGANAENFEEKANQLLTPFYKVQIQ